VEVRGSCGIGHLDWSIETWPIGKSNLFLLRLVGVPPVFVGSPFLEVGSAAILSKLSEFRNRKLEEVRIGISKSEVAESEVGRSFDPEFRNRKLRNQKLRKSEEVAEKVAEKEMRNPNRFDWSNET